MKHELVLICAFFFFFARCWIECIMQLFEATKYTGRIDVENTSTTNKESMLLQTRYLQRSCEERELMHDTERWY